MTRPGGPAEPRAAEPRAAEPHRLVTGAKTLSLMPTFRCTAECADCGTLSSPREDARLDLTTIRSAIDQARELGFALVVFTGGETTLVRRDLLTAVRYATDAGLPTRVVTNAYWARSPAAAGRVLDQLLDAGLSEINYSTGDEHVRFVPVERVAIAIVEAALRKLPVHVMVELRAARAVTRDSLLAHPELARLDPAQRAGLSVLESPWMPLDPDRVESYPDGVAATAANLASRSGCDSVLRTYTVQADGRVAACCGLGMRMIDELNVSSVDRPGFLAEAVDAGESDLLKLWIHALGPERVLAWAAEKDPSIAWENRYGHRCQACHRVYRDPAVARVLREHHEEVIQMVIETIWLDGHYLPKLLAGGPVRPAR